MKCFPLLFSLLVASALRVGAADSVIVFNEVHYHPANEGTQTEWIELRSLQGVDVEIGGWRLEGAVDFTFPAGTIMLGGSYRVVAAVQGQIANSLGPWTGQLSNSGDTIRLVNRNGRIMDELEYEDAGDWPVAPDGSGVTLARRRATAASGPEQWAPSTQLGGTPGGVNQAEGGAAVRTVIAAIGAAWKFEDSGNAAPAGWQTAAFNDASWKTDSTLIAGGGGQLSRGVRPIAFPNGLLAHWAFDETSGTVAANGAAGQPAGEMVNGAAFISDATRGRVASFDGANDRMEIIDPNTGLPSLVFLPDMTAANDFTWAAWVWTTTGSTAADQSGAVILGNRTNPNGADNTPREFFKITPTATSYHRNGATESLDYPDLATSAWTHLCVVKRGLNLDYYRNGVFVQTRAVSGGFVNPALPFYVGGDRSGTTEHFQGRVDDVGLWTRALSVAEVSQLGGFYGAAPTLPTPPEQATNAVAGPEPRYFRKSFNFNGTPGTATLELWPVADDGVIFYLNGTEIWRNNVPPASEVTDAKFNPTTINVSNTALVFGGNVLSAEVQQFPGGNSDLLFGAEFAITAVPGPPPASPPALVLSEIAAFDDPNFFLEFRNTAATAVSTSGWTLRTSAGQTIALPVQSVAAGAYVSFSAAALGLTPSDGLRLTLLSGGSEYRDARAITGSLRGLTSDGIWGHPSDATPDGANVVALNTAIVINEIFYHAVGTSPEEWIELYNNGAASVNLGGWQFTDGIDFTFPVNTIVPPGGYVVVAWDPAALTARHPGVNALGPWSGGLSGAGELLRLRDANENVADEVRYADGGKWSQWADGGGSSLELIDPDADNSKGGAWDASDESSRSTWQTVSSTAPDNYRGTAANPNAGDPVLFNEFVLGLLAGGECLIDDLSVKNVTLGNVELLQNGNFNAGTAAFWRIIGNHAGTVVDDPTSPGNKVLKISASGPTEHMHNHAETTLKQGASFHTINPAHTYAIEFRAKWLRGSNRLHTRLWHNRLARQTLLNMPATGGTPGAMNSRFNANLGPTFDALAHSPVVPAAFQAATVSVKVADPDGLGAVQLFRSLNGGAFTNVAMTTTGGGIYTATITGQSTNALVQFYIRATDALGAISFFPAAGPASRAMIPWQDNRAQLQLATGARPHNFRVVVPTADASNLYKLENVMSNGGIPCTVIYDEREVYYHADFRLKSSEHGRYNDTRVGYVVGFGNDEPFLGVHGTVSVDRSGGTSAGQKEILIKTVSNVAGGIYAPEDDLIRLIAPIGTTPPAAYNGSALTGAAILSKTRFDDTYLDNQWPDGGSGPIFKYERVYVLTQTINPTTRAIDSTIVPENPKIPQDSTSPPGVPVGNLGASKENYRWYWLLENGRDADDYSKLISSVTAIGQAAGSQAFKTQTQQHLEVSTFLRAHVPATLYGVTDNYLTGGGQHNVLLYFPPGGKGVLIPWDLDFLAQGDSAASLINGADLGKFIADPVNKRLYYGHLLDVLTRSFNSAFLTRWAQHYSTFGTDDFTGSLSYLTSRAAYANSVIFGTNGQTPPIAPVTFARTTASPLNVSTPTATVTGDGWINIAEIRLAGSSQPLAVTWVDDNTWTLQLPISAGSRTYALVAYNSLGVQIGTTSIVINGTGGLFPAAPGNLVVSELHYNPPGNSDLTEFLELLNITGATLDLSNCHFDEELGEGIAYTFPAGTQIAAGGRILVVRDRAEFIAAYPTATPLAPNQFTGALDNSGESLVLYAASGLEIFRFSYSDSLGSTDGGGRSLVRVLSSSNPDGSTYVWRASTADKGNPGASDGVAFAGLANADGDFDGLVALLEYALGTSASSPTAAPITFTRDATGNCFLTFTRPVNADDVTLAIEVAVAPGAIWSPANASRIGNVLTGNLATETWQLVPPVGSTNYFVRLKATLR